MAGVLRPRLPREVPRDMQNFVPLVFCDVAGTATGTMTSETLELGLLSILGHLPARATLQQCTRRYDSAAITLADFSEIVAVGGACCGRC